MTIPNLPQLDPFSPTFRSDVDAFFQGQIQASINGLNVEIARINDMGAGSLSATSTTTLTIASSGTVSLTIETGKGFAIGQAILVASTASPGNWMAGQVISYDSATGALEVGVIAAGGAGSFSDWTISVTALVPGTPQLDSIIVLTSGTSWTVPDGVRKVVGYVEGGCSGGPGSTNAGSTYYALGAGGGGLIFVAPVNSGEVLTYSIGAGGAERPANANNPGLPGGDTYVTIGGVEYRATGGAGASNVSTFALGGDGVQVANSWAVKGGSSPAYNVNGQANVRGGQSAFGFGSGGRSGTSVVASTAGDPGRIVLELYK